jgi:uncharacterized membrane protein
MPPVIVAYLASLASIIALDAAWLTATFARLYRPRLGHLFAEAPSWAPVALFYLLYAAAVVLFAVSPALRSDAPLQRAFLLGAALGLVAYGTYDLTNQATMRAWPAAITAIDMAWGALLTGAAALAATYLARRFG